MRRVDFLKILGLGLIGCNEEDMNIKKVAWFLNGSSGISSPFDVFSQAGSSWWRSTVGVTTTGADVDSVVDQGGMARNLTGLAGAKPTLAVDSNGRPYFNFTNNAFTFNVTNYATVADDFQVIVVFESSETAIPTTTEKRFINMVNGTRIATGYNANGASMPPSYQMASNVSAFHKSKQGYIPSRVHVIRFDFTDPAQRIYVNGVLDSGSATAYTKQTLTSGLVGTIGRTAGGTTLNIVGKLYEVMLVKGTYSDVDKAKVDQYFLNLYGSYDKTAFVPNGKSASFVSETKILDTDGQPATDDYVFHGMFSFDSEERMHITYTRGENHQNNSNQKLIYRYTDDYGTNVSAEQVILTSFVGTRYTTSQVIRTPSGRLLLSYTTINYVAGTLFANMKYSDDNGANWADITGAGADGLITTHYGPPGYVVGIGNMIILDDGTILHVLYGRAAGTGTREVLIFKSVDDGQTWTYVSTMAPPTARDYEETCIIKGRNGLLIAIMRSDQAGSAYVSYSWDSGLTWIYGPVSTADRPIAFSSIGGYSGGACSPSGGILAYGRSSDASWRTTVNYAADGGYAYVQSNQSSRTGAYMYGQFQWSNVLGQFVGVHAEENVGATLGLGPCSVYITRYQEV